MAYGFENAVIDSYTASYLKAYWSLEETGANNRLDKIGTNHLIATNTPATRTGKYNNACDFIAASTQYLSIADNTDLSAITGFLAVLWAYRDDSGTTRFLVGKIQSGAASWYLLPTASGFNFVMTQADTTQKSISNITLAAGAWKQIIAMATGGVVRVIVDGVEWGTTIAYNNTILAEAYPFYVGRDPWGGNYMDGGIDELAWYKDIVFADAAARNAFISAYWNGGAGRFLHLLPVESVLERTSGGLLLRTSAGVLERT